MELRHLRYFVTVVAEGSFTRAAEKLRMAQPPLSRQIQQLERDVGVSLLNRRGRPLSTTEAGRFFHEHALHVLDQVEMMMVMTKTANSVEKGRFRIGFVGSTLYGPLPDLVRRFRSSYPDLDITMSELTTLQQVDALKKGRIDIGFGRLQFDDPDVKQDVLREERLVAALPIGHRLLNSFGSLRLKDLASESLIIYPKHPRPSYADQVLSLFRERKLEPAHVDEVSELQSALGLAAAALGICLVPASVQRLRRDDIVYRDLTDKTAISPIIMTCRATDTSSAITALRQTFLKLYNQE
jgi:DNA-binding transcriptional LysR family regulator